MKQLIPTGLVCLALVPAFAHESATGIVKERMDAMKSVASATKTIGQTLKGEMAYDAAILREAAELITAGARLIPALFPENSLHKPTEATPAIWLEWDLFVKSAEEMGAAARQLAETADDPGQVKSHFSDLAATCKACHNSYRIKQ